MVLNGSSIIYMHREKVLEKKHARKVYGDRFRIISAT
jgi:hypothetical protein